MKVKIIDPKGILVDGNRLPKGQVIEAGGAQLKAWLHFKQVEPAEGQSAGDIKNPPTGTKADHDKAQLADRQKDFQDRRAARAVELLELNRKEQLKLIESLGITPVKDAKEGDLVEAILQVEFAQEKEALGL
jgi:hypothetical protein